MIFGFNFIVIESNGTIVWFFLISNIQHPSHTFYNLKINLRNTGYFSNTKVHVNK